MIVIPLSLLLVLLILHGGHKNHLVNHTSAISHSNKNNTAVYHDEADS